MKKIFCLLMLAFLASIALYACGGGGSGTSEALAVPPTVLNGGVAKDILVSNNTSGIFGQYSNITSEVTVDGSMISFLDENGKQAVYINAPVKITER
jgi:ABC-type glycerol-3-phosphate transport system substrate-binding protein